MMDRSAKVWFVLAGAAVAAALADQLRRPAGERTWHGRVAGIPYDFRLPTPARLRATFWNPDNPSLLAPHAFGVGWSLNLYRLAHPKVRSTLRNAWAISSVTNSGNSQSSF